MHMLGFPVDVSPGRRAVRSACMLGLLAVCGCDAQHGVLFTATRDNGAVLGLTASGDACEAGAKLAYLTNELRTLRGCWVRARSDIRASFPGMAEIRIASSEFQATARAERRNLAIESFEESPLHAAGKSRRN